MAFNCRNGLWLHSGASSAAVPNVVADGAAPAAIMQISGDSANIIDLL